MDPKTKLCACKSVLHGIKKADCISQTITGWYCHKTCCFSLHTCDNFMTLPYQANARFISASTRTKPKMTNTGVANRQCRIYSQIALLQWCKWNLCKINKWDTWASLKKLSGLLLKMRQSQEKSDIVERKNYLLPHSHSISWRTFK